MRAAPLQSNFNGGEFGPLTQGRVESPKYKTGVAKCVNWLPTIQGPLIRRPGTEYVAGVKNNADPTRLQTFKFSTTDSFIFEFGDSYVRFYKEDGQLQDAGMPYEVATPYAAEDVFDLKFVQTANLIYLLHPGYPPAKLVRTTDISWAYTVVTFIDGPYLPTNATSTTFTSSGVSGSVTITASAVGGINNGAGFKATDVGRYIRLKNTNWSNLLITAFTDTTHVTATVVGPAVTTAASTSWRLGLWSETTGYPSCGCFHQDRLSLGGGNIVYPQRIDLSNSGDYENFAPSDATGTIIDSNAMALNLRSNDVNSIFWQESDEKGLLAGTSANEWVITSAGAALTPTDVGASQPTSYGSKDIAAARVGKSTMFAQVGGTKLREMGYNFYVSGFRSPDRTVIANNIAGSGLGFKQLAYQKTPHSILWAVREDGVLAAMTYEHDEEQDSIVTGWSRHLLGNFATGEFDIGPQALVESVAVMPSTDGTYDEVWLVVNRIGGNPLGPDAGNNRFIEVLTKFDTEFDDEREAWFLDAGLMYNDPLAISALASGIPNTTVTITAHGYSNGDTVLLEELGLNNDGLLNGKTFVILNVTSNTFDIPTPDGAGGFTLTGVSRKCVSIVTGIDHLEGRTVAIFADGAVRGSQVVTGGQVPVGLPKASRVIVGLPYDSDGQMLRLDAGSQIGSSIGKTRRTHRVSFDLYRTNGLQFGLSFDALDNLPLRMISDEMGVAVPLFTGIVSESLDADYDFDNQICFRANGPFPATIRSITPDMETQDRL